MVVAVSLLSCVLWGRQVRYFKGIPYAADTSGANRWLPPQPRPAWTSPLNATELGPGCFQVRWCLVDPTRVC